MNQKTILIIIGSLLLSVQIISQGILKNDGIPNWNIVKLINMQQNLDDGQVLILNKARDLLLNNLIDEIELQDYGAQSDFSPYGLLIDLNNNFWMGTFYQGIAKFDGTSISQLEDPFLFTALGKSLDGEVFFSKDPSWGISTGGLISYKNGFRKEYSLTEMGFPNNGVRSFIEGDNGEYWFNILSYDSEWAEAHFQMAKLSGGNWSLYSHLNSSLPDASFTKLEFANGNLYIGTTNNGLLVFDGINTTVYNTSNSNIQHNYISSIAIDHDGIIWIGGHPNEYPVAETGLSKFDGVNWTNYTMNNSNLPGNSIFDIVLNKGEVWFESAVTTRSSSTSGSQGQYKLVRFDGSNFNVEFDSSVRGITNDNNGNVFWIKDTKLYKWNHTNNQPSLTYNQIDASNFPEIKSYVSVSDGDGNSISGLTSSNFVVKEGTTTQTPITVSSVGAIGSNISAALVLDKSSSMSQEIADAKTAAIQFINNMQANDKGAVVSFGSSVALNQTFTSDKTLLIDAINSISATDNSTKLYDGLYEGISQTSSQSGRKAVISLSDGGDNASSKTETDVISYANQLSIPVFTIGLGLTQGSFAEQSLINIAEETGGQYYYAPNSNELSSIYQSISQQINSQYLITYTSSDPNCGANERTVNITAEFNGSSDSKSKTYTPPVCGSNGNIKPVSPADVMVNNEFIVDVKVGDPNQVTDLFGASFKLVYETTHLDFVSAVPYTWFGSDLVYYSDNNETAGEVSIGVSRKSPSTGVNGSGVIYRLKFTANNNTPNNTEVTFSITDLFATNSSGVNTILEPLTSTTNIVSGLEVWPGDNNNNGIVDQADVLPLGLYWNKTGSPRNNSSSQWVAQLCEPWDPEAATYADGNGDGEVDQADVLPIGSNWGKSRTSTIIAKNDISKEFEGRLTIDNIEYQESNVNLRVNYIGSTEADNLYGVSYSIRTTQGVEIKEIINGDYFGDDILCYFNKGNTQLNAGYSIVKKSADFNSSNVSEVNVIKIDLSDITTATIELVNVIGINESGREISIKGTQITINGVTSVENEIPSDYNLKQNYPNPFNPKTLIEYSLKNSGFVKLSIYNLLGEEIKVLVSEYQNSGNYSISFDGSELPSGVYLYRIETGEYANTKKLLLLK